MSWSKRVREVMVALLMLAAAVVMALFPTVGYVLVQLFLSATLVLAGLGRIGYYLTMARHMVGGKVVLYTGIFLLDLGILAGSLTRIPQAYVLVYLLVIHLFDGVVSIMRAREQKGYGAGPWRLTLAMGVANVLVALVCLVFIRSTDVAVYVFSVGLAYSACLRIATAFRKTAIVYIQ